MRHFLPLTVALGIALSPAVLAAQVEQCSVNTAGTPGFLASFVGDVDGSGSLVVFSSLSGNLVAGDTGGFSDVFLRDRSTGTTVVLSASNAGAFGDGSSSGPRLSADGRWVVFVSSASNLLPGDLNSRSDVFLRDLQTGQISIVSRAASGAQGNANSGSPSISQDGSRIAFASDANNLVPGDSNGFDDIFVVDNTNGTIVRVSVAAGGVETNSHNYRPALSADGNFVAFLSTATNLAAGDTNGTQDVFVHELATGVTTIASAPPSGGIGNDGADSAALSHDGRFVVFSSRSTNLTAGVPNSTFHHPYLHDRWLNTTVRIDLTATGAYANKNGFPIGVSQDGRYVWFRSSANQLALGDLNGRADVFVRDLQLAVNFKLTQGFDGTGTQGETDGGAVSANGAYLAIESRAANIVPGDFNNVADVFVLSAGGASTTLYVDQDGDGYGDPASWTSGAPGTPGLVTVGRDCDDADPATNPGAADPCDGRDRDCDGTTDEGCITYYCTTSTTTHGCHPLMFVGGYASATAQTPFHLAAFDVEGARAGLFFYGLAPAAGVWAPGSTSTKCVQSPIQRMGAIQSGGTNGQCDGLLLYDMNAYLQAHPGALGAPFPAGGRLYAQAWFRDPSAPKGTNLSDAVEILLGP